VPVQVRANQLESSFAETDPPRGLLMDTKMTMHQQYAFVAKQASSLLGCTRQSFTSRSREMILPLSSAEVRPHLQYWVPFWAPQYKRSGLTGETTSVIKGLEHLSYKERLREMGLFSQEKRQLRGVLSVCINN